MSTLVEIGQRVMTQCDVKDSSNVKVQGKMTCLSARNYVTNEDIVLKFGMCTISTNMYLC